MINYDIKGLYKTTCFKTKSNFLIISFLIDCCVSVFFSFLMKACANLEKYIKMEKI